MFAHLRQNVVKRGECSAHTQVFQGKACYKGTLTLPGGFLAVPAHVEIGDSLIIRLN